jgi:VCBS repeat-containing protein
VLQPSDESPNLDPAAGHYKATTDEDKPVSGRVQATDPDGDTLSYTKGSDPAHGTVTVKPDGSWTYTPGANFHGDDSFTVTVSDGKGGFTTATIDIGVKSVNDLPVLQPSTESPNLDPASGHYKLTTDEDKPVSGRVQATDPDGDPLSYAKGSDPAHGTVTVKPDGSWTYTPGANFHGDDSFTVTVSDGKGGFTTATIDIGVKSVNDAPVVTIPGSPSALSEEGLAGGNADTQGSSDTGNAKETAGRISFSDAEGDKVTLSLSGPSGLTSGGVAVTWSGSGSPTDPLIGKAGDKPILSATIDAQGNYKITLQGAIDHANTATEDVRDVSLTVKASDGTSTTTSTLTFQIEDDSPLSGAQVMRVDANTGSQNTNLMLIIDTSGSMQNTLADRTANGIKAAIKSLIDRYDDIGDVKIQIVTFSDGAQGRAAWMTVAQAKTFVDTLTANGGTNYDAALAAAKASFAVDGKLANAVNVSYFITDGQPNTGKGIDTGAEETNWEAFLKANHIDSYAVGTGTLTAQYIANIEPIAYNGITGTEQGATTLKTNAELTKYLIDTVPTIKAGSLAGLAGADGLARVESFSSGKQVSSVLDAGTKILTITLSSGAEIKLNTVTGDFTMKQGRDGGDETFSYTLVDKDGDRASGSVTLTTAAKAAANHAPEAYIGSDGHNILGLVDLSVNPLLNLAKDQHVAVNDVDNNLIRVDVSVGQVLSLGTLLGDHSKLTLALDPALTQGLHITGNDTRHLVIESDTAGHTIDVAQVNKLLATLAYDPAHVLGLSLDLFPQLTVKATDAAGATATKTVSSSLLAVDVDATDIANKVEHLVSGAGEHHGSCDTDVFAWSLADHHEGSEHHADTIHDFNCAARSAGGDVLDLRDLLQADHHAAAGTGDVDKLLHFLDFDTQSQPGSTIIHVSGSGGFQADASGHSESAGCADQQHIVLANVDIRSSLGLDQQANDHQIITELMNRGKLLVDNC